MAQYAKSIAALLTALGTWGATAAADGRYDSVELWALTGVLVTALAVFALPNTPPTPPPLSPSADAEPAQTATPTAAGPDPSQPASTVGVVGAPARRSRK